MIPDPPFELTLPAHPASPAIFASPHSGRAYPAELRAMTVLDPVALRSSEDAFVDELIGAAPLHGAPLLCARVPRAWVDFNRSPDELDPALIAGVQRGGTNPRIASGLGVVPRVVASGRAIYRGKIPRQDAEARLRLCWHPYHARLAGLIADHQDRFGEAILIDMHSMPHEALLGSSGPAALVRPPEIVLGDRFGASAAPHVTDLVEAAFRAAGLRVARNAPFAGAYVAERYGRPAAGCHVVQVEIDRALYMDERRVVRLPGFAAFRRLMSGVVADLAAIGRSEVPLAAE